MSGLPCTLAVVSGPWPCVPIRTRTADFKSLTLTSPSTRQCVSSIHTVAFPVFKIGRPPLKRGGGVRLPGASAIAVQAPLSHPRASLLD